MINDLLSRPSFWLGLLIRAFAIAFLPTANAITVWYAPFIQQFAAQPLADPWQSWLISGGDLQAFPYGFGMLAAAWPLSAFSAVTNFGISATLAYQLTLFLFDIGLFVVSLFLSNQNTTKAITFYWLSPITLISIYVLGLNDVIPVCVLMLSVLLLRQSRFILSGALLAVAISIKLSMALAVPVFVILFIRNRAMRSNATKFFLSFGVVTTALVTPLAALSPSWVSTISGNEEALKIWAPVLKVGEQSAVLLVPLAYVAALYLIWRLRRVNFSLFEASLGLVFLVVVLTVQSSPGWYLWVLPLLLAINSDSLRRTGLLVWLFGVAFVLTNSPAILDSFGVNLALTELQLNLLHTCLIATGFLLAVRVWRYGVTTNDFFVLSRKPFAIGIAGDSGVGKDTFANAITAVFGAHSTTHLSGDDYHLWDRGRPMWQAVTHLNPVANNLTQLERDAISLLSGRSVQVRHYNHETGIYDRRSSLRSNDFLIFSGLHTLRLPSLPSMLDLTIFLDMDEELRRALKIHRDVNVRGHSVEKVEQTLERRAPDVEEFITPQRHRADLVFTLSRNQTNNQRSAGVATPDRVTFETRLGLDVQELRRVLVSLTQIEIDSAPNFEGNGERVHMHGHVDGDAISAAAKILAPRVLEFCDHNPQWSSGPLGLMQLVFFAQLEHVLTRRSLN